MISQYISVSALLHSDSSQKLLAQGITWFLYEPLVRPFFPSTFIAVGAGVANVADFWPVETKCNCQCLRSRKIAEFSFITAN
jgi:hypothetical protein